MRIRKRWLCFIIWSASICHLQAHDADSALRLPTDSTLTYSDSLNIFYLIDSLLTLEEHTPSSQLAVRLAYNSNVLYAGQTLGIDQFGLSPGVSFYHKTGLYGDLSAFWSHDFEPHFYLTVLSVGYLHTFSSKLSFNVGYDRYFTINNDFLKYKNTLTATPYLDLNLISFSLNYSFYFSETSVHRLMPAFNLNLEKKKFLKLDKVTFTPSIYVLFGNERWPEVEIIYPTTALERFQNYNRYGTPYKIVVTEKNAFGVMNYAFSFPLNITHKKWNFLVSYTYNIPKALPGDPLTLPESGFVAAGITYYINLKKNKLSL